MEGVWLRSGERAIVATADGQGCGQDRTKGCVAAGEPGNNSAVEFALFLTCAPCIALSLQNNELSGGLPAALTTLSQLQTLNLGYNKLNGRCVLEHQGGGTCCS